MDIIIRDMESKDKGEVLEMMKVFYDSPAVFFDVDEDILKKDIEDCVGDCPFVEGFIFEDQGRICGYGMTAMCYATEFGGLCVWIEDLYIKPEYRRQKLGSRFFDFLEKHYPEAVRFKLEVETENIAAIETYKCKGYGISPYFVMTKEM